jgi:hypothetical protein
MKAVKYSAVFLTLCFVACNQREEPKEQITPPSSQAPNAISEEAFTDTDSVEYDVDDEQLDFYRPTQQELEETSLTNSKKVTVTLHSITYGTREGFGRGGVAKFERVVNSKTFKTAVLKTKFEDDRGLTSQQIYDKIIGAKENHANDRNGVIDLRMRLITTADGPDINKKCNRTKNPIVGRDGGKTGIMNTCPNWVQKRVAAKDTAAMARHIAHEYMHRFGFTHPNVNRKSVPYKIGGIVQMLARKLR